MAWVIDSCILLDVALKDPTFGTPSALHLEKIRNDGLVVCPISVVELTPQFGGQVGNVREFLKVLGADPYPSWTEADTDRAADGWSRYVNRKRAGTVPKRPVADLLIGGYACRFQGLVTRNPEHFQPFYPDLTIAEP